MTNSQTMEVDLRASQQAYCEGTHKARKLQFLQKSTIEATFTQKIGIIENEMERDSPNTELLHGQSSFVYVPLPDQVCIDHCRYTTLQLLDTILVSYL